MVWRKWLVRCLVFTIAGTVTAAAAMYQYCTNPRAVREQVISRIQDHLPGARTRIESASLRLLGGISLQDLSFHRRDDPKETTFLNVPRGTIFHDKEQLLDGKLAIRKIEFYKPWLRVVRGADGRWNLKGILGPVDLTKTIPTIILKQATVYVEDLQCAPRAPAVEIKDMTLTIVNDPITTLVINGSGSCNSLGQVEIRGSLRRDTDELRLSLKLQGVPVTGDLVERLAAYQPEAASHLRQLRGKLELSADLHFDPQAKPAWTYALNGKLVKGTFSHARVPLTLEQVEGHISVVDGRLTLENLSARNGDMRLEASGALRPVNNDYDLDGRVTVGLLKVDRELLSGLGEIPANLGKDFNLRGPLSFYVELRRRSGQWYSHCLFKPENMVGSCAKFPYELDQIRGDVELELDSARGLNQTRIDLVGHSLGKEVKIGGTVSGKSPMGIDVQVDARDLPIDTKLRAALKRDHQKIVDSFSPTGQVNVHVDVVRPQGQPDIRNTIKASFHNACMSYEQFPYPVEQISGILEIHPDHWEFHDFVGSHKGATFSARGGSWPAGPGEPNELRMVFGGNGVLLDEELRGGLKQPSLQKTWTGLNPKGRITFEARVNQRQGAKEPDIGVTVTPLLASIRPTAFPYELENLSGKIEYQNRQVKLENVACKHGSTDISLREGKVHSDPAGGFSIDLWNLHGGPVWPSPDFVGALPPTLARAVTMLQLREPFALQVEALTIKVPADTSPPYIFWDGGVDLQNASARAGIPFENVTGTVSCRGSYCGKLDKVEGNVALRNATIFGQPFQRVYSEIRAKPERAGEFLLPNIQADLFRGKVGGQVRVSLNENVRYEIFLTATQVQLADLGSHNHLGAKAHLSGLAGGQVYLTGMGTDLANLEGNGQVEVPSGKMYNLPIILDLLKVLALRLPDGTAFEEARVQFSIKGRTVKFSRLDFLGNAVSLVGQGTMDIDGKNLHLDFYAVRGAGLLPPVFDKGAAMISSLFLKIEVRGSLDHVRCTPEPLPIVFDRVKAIWHRLGGRDADAPRNSPGNTYN